MQTMTKSVILFPTLPPSPLYITYIPFSSPSPQTQTWSTQYNPNQMNNKRIPKNKTEWPPQEKSSEKSSNVGSDIEGSDYDVEEEYDNDYAENYFDNGEGDDMDDLGDGGGDGGG